VSKAIITVPALIHGVSQQAQSARFLSQADLQENAYPSVVTGLSKRQPLNLLADLGELGLDSATKVHLINRSPDERYVVLTDNDGVRVFELDGTEVPVHDDTNGPSFDPDFSYLDNGFESPQDAHKLLTIADYTLVLNRLYPLSFPTTGIIPELSDLSDSLPANDVLDPRVLVFVRAGNYKTNYRLALGPGYGGAPDEQYQVSTWDGVAAVGAQPEIWKITIWGAPGSTGTWSVSVLGQTANASILSSDSLAGAATKVAAAINGSITGVSATSSSDFTHGYVFITADDDGVDISPFSVPAPNWHQAIQRTQAGALDEIASIKTDDIAQSLADLINNREYTGGHDFRAERSGSVLLVHGSGIGSLPMTAKASDSTGSNTALYAFAESTPDFDLLPLTAPDGHKIRVSGDTVDPADDYYVAFEADTEGEFGQGHWEESLGGAVVTKFVHASMPWTLVRKTDDSLGTVTGTPDAKYFNWTPAPWVDRHVGDDTTAPVPSIFPVDVDGLPLPGDGNPVSDIAFYRNRLVFTSGQHLVMSGVNTYFDLWRTTTRSLPDSDPIDLVVPHTSVVRLNHAEPLNEKLVLFADQGQFVVDGDPTLTPKTVQCSLALNFTALQYADPIVSERGLFFPYNRGDFSGIRGMSASRTVVDQFDTEEITLQVPQYIDGDVVQMASSHSSSSVFVLAAGDRSALWVYKYNLTEEGAKTQSAWSKYPLGEGVTIMGLGFINQQMIVVLRRQGTQDDSIVLPWTIESMDVIDNLVDPGADYLTHLDQRFRTSAGVYNAMNNTTTWTVTHNLDDAAVYQVVPRSLSGNEGGDVHALAVTSATTLAAEGDYGGDPVWIGRQYTMRYRFSQLGLKKAGEQGTQRSLNTGSLKIIRGLVTHDRSVAYRVEVTPQHGDTIVYPFDANVASDAILGELNLDTGTHDFGVHSRNDRVQIEIVNDSPLPSNFQSAEFTAHADLGGYSPYN
jgi:hypothetical protein